MAKADKSYSRILSEFAVALKYDDIPKNVVAKVKDQILDTIGCLLSGSTMDWSRRIYKVAKCLGGNAEATLIGDGARVGVAPAAFGNGSLGRALDLDDTHFRAWGHVSAYAVPTALTVGEWLHKSGSEVITATIAEYEVGCRVGRAGLRDSQFFYDSSTPGTITRAAIRTHGPVFATAVGAGKLVGLDVDQMTSAMGFAGSLGNFLNQSHREKTLATPFDTGWTCHAGVISALTAEAGLLGPQKIFEGDRGFFQAVVAPAPYDLSRLVENLGTMWESAQSTIKLYPAGHGTHYFLNSVKQLMKNGLRAEDVQQIICNVPEMRAELHFSPKEKVYNPSPYDARFSMPYLLAVLLVDGHVGVNSFTDEKVRNPQILDVARRVTYTIDEGSWSLENRGQIVVMTKDGRRLGQKTPHSQLPGTAENPAPREEITRKFCENASFVLSPSNTDKLLQTLENLEDVGNIAEVMRMMVP